MSISIGNDDTPHHLPYFAFDGSNRLRKFLSRETVNNLTDAFPQALAMLTLVLNSVQKRSDEFGLEDYGSIEVLPYCQR